ncbi:MAG: NUDIX domain-containing protein [Desulfuromonadales bacterium]|nr:NUDIX domain-containing protein [Desulfuromonadales bacterium]
MEFTKQHIKTSVVACIIDDRSRVLLTRRCIEPFCGQWVMPGGKIDHGETILAALHREVREEVGLEIHVDRLLDVYEHVAHGAARNHYVILYYRAHPVAGELTPNGTEVTEALWVGAEELPRYNMTPGTRHILAQIYRDRLVDPGEPVDELAHRDLAESLGLSG